MNRESLISSISTLLDNTAKNIICEGDSTFRYLNGERLYDTPIVRFGAADDPLFSELKRPEAIGPHALLPQEWLPEAKTVISIFLPVTDAIRRDNRQQMDWPSPGWLYARIEGQNMIRDLTAALVSQLREAGYHAIAPSLDERLYVNEDPHFTSNWSERHIAYICGSGTFGLSKGLITEKGVAGRFTSVITSLALTPDTRNYSGLYDYCSMCGACVRNCPAGAITLDGGKDHRVCSEYLDLTREKFRPRYGCGKCQIKVPCETRACIRRSTS